MKIKKFSHAATAAVVAATILSLTAGGVGTHSNSTAKKTDTLTNSETGVSSIIDKITNSDTLAAIKAYADENDTFVGDGLNAYYNTPGVIQEYKTPISGWYQIKLISGNSGYLSYEGNDYEGYVNVLDFYTYLEKDKTYYVTIGGRNDSKVNNGAEYYCTYSDGDKTTYYGAGPSTFSTGTGTTAVKYDNASSSSYTYTFYPGSTDTLNIVTEGIIGFVSSRFGSVHYNGTTLTDAATDMNQYVSGDSYLAPGCMQDRSHKNVGDNTHNVYTDSTQLTYEAINGKTYSSHDPGSCTIKYIAGGSGSGSDSGGSSSGGSSSSQFTINFDPNKPADATSDVKNSMAPQTVSGTDHLSGNVYELDGYHFSHWATTAADSGDGNVDYADQASITPGGNMTLYAQWEKDDSGVTVTIPQSISINKKSVGAVNAKETYPIKVLNPGRKKVSITSTISDLSIGSGKSKETISARLYSSKDANGNPVQINVTGPNTTLNDTLVLSGTTHYAGKYTGHAQYSVNIA